MKKYTWQEIIDKKEDSIKLIGYGSLLNNNTHHSDHEQIPVVFNGFKRVYNLRVIPLNPSEEWKEYFKIHLRKYGIVDKETEKKYISNKSAVLNCIYTGDLQDSVNGLCIEIQKSEIKEYSARESQYSLYETNYTNICPESGKETTSDQTAYVLVAHKSTWLEEGIPFHQYHQNTRNGAYKIGQAFGKLFDKTTFNTQGEIIKNI